MEVLHYSALLFITTIFFISLKHLEKKKKKNELLPPSPPGFPIIGHLHLLSKRGPKHRVLKSLSDKYGPIIYLRLGNRPTVIVSSASVAEECFTKNDIVLANRPQFSKTNVATYNNTSLIFSPYGQHWRNLRRITTLHVFSSLSIQRSAAIRAEEIKFSVRKMLSSSLLSESWKEMNFTSFFQDLAQDMIMKMVCGERWCDSADVYKKLATIGLGNVSDYIPILRWIGFNGAMKKVIDLHKQADKFLQDLIEEGRRRSRRKSDEQRKTLVQEYLSLQEVEPEHYTDDLIKVLIQFMLVAGSDTSSLTMQWVMAHLLNRPEMLEKARNEIDKNITTERLIEDSDLHKLPYLHCIISETLRLFPIAPLLVPHFSSEDCTISGYNIPRGTIFLINAWAIHRDPNLWEEPDEFKPERFEGIEVGREGFKFLPFGKGRRSCPGNNLAMRFMGLALGTLIQCFELKRLGSEMVDLNEKEGAALHKANPLIGLFRPRQATIHLLPKFLS